jgi:hypothetical protein
MGVLDFFDPFFAAVLFTMLLLGNRGRTIPVRANEVDERSLAANAATSTIQGGVAIGGFLFAGLFALMFQPDFKILVNDFMIGLGWTVISLISGGVNIVLLPTSIITHNYVATPLFTFFLYLQFSALIGAFVRLTLLILKYMTQT